MSLDDRAKAKLVETNLRLVVAIAKTYRTPERRFLDVIDDGNVGLMKAVESYEGADLDRVETASGEKRSYVNMMDGSVVEADERFETYAAPFIHAEIERGIANATSSANRSSADREALDRLQNLRSLLSGD